MKGTAEAKAQVWQEVDRTREAVIERCCQLVRIPSENPPGDTTALARHMLDLLHAHGIVTEVYEPKPQNPNIVAHLRSFQRNARTFVFNGHLDTFPVGDPSDWSMPPFCGEVRDGKIFGKGIADMKGGLSASLSALLILRALEVPLAGNVILMMVSDEETLGPWGTRWVLEQHPEYRGDACLIGEPGGGAGVVGAITVGGKGILWLRLTVKGEAYHGGLCEGESAITRTGRIFRLLEGVHGLKGKMPEELSEVVAAARSMKARNRTLDEVITTVNVNVGTIRGGTKVNVVPSQATMEVDIRLPLGWTPERMEGLVRERLAAEGLGDVVIEVFNSSPPYYMSPKDPLTQIVSDNAQAVFNEPVPLRYTHACGDNRFFRMFGVPVINYGCPGYSGIPNEFTWVESLIGVTKVHAATPIDVLGLR